MPTNRTPISQEEFISFFENPHQLESFYRKEPSCFRELFMQTYPSVSHLPVAECWQERLFFQSADRKFFDKKELLFIAIAATIAGFLAKLPDFFDFQNDLYYSRNISFIILPLLSFYFIWKQKASAKTIIVTGSSILLSCIYINLLPNPTQSDSIVQACIHLAFLMWILWGNAYLNGNLFRKGSKVSFLQFNANWVIMCGILILAGFLFSGLVLGMFELINLNIQEFYFRYIAIFGIAAIPVIGTYLVEQNPELVNKISPVIARIFTPLVFVTLLIFLIALLGKGQSPFNDRDLLLIFNGILIGVMAIILFSLNEIGKFIRPEISLIVLLGLALLAILSNGIALSAIIYRLFSFGITVNRTAILGGNLLILCNLLLVIRNLILALRKKATIEKIENSIAAFLPAYGIWAAIVTFLFPLLFGLK